jgi:hypothetical protein
MRLISLFLICVSFGFGQKKLKPKSTRILFVFDASKSMKTEYNGITRMEGAKKLFYKFIDSLSKDKTYQFKRLLVY